MSPNLQTSPSSPRRGFFKCGFSGYSRPTTTPSRLDLRVDIEARLPRAPIAIAVAARTPFLPARSGWPGACEVMDAVEGFFGASLTSTTVTRARAGTRDSRHDEPRAPTPVDSNPGDEEDTLPSYRDALAAEPERGFELTCSSSSDAALSSSGVHVGDAEIDLRCIRGAAAAAAAAAIPMRDVCGLGGGG